MRFSTDTRARSFSTDTQARSFSTDTQARSFSTDTRGRSFSADTRGRVPFAVLGALLLVSSTIFATTAVPEPARTPVADDVIDQAQTNARVALSTAVRDAGRRAARRPLIDPADSDAGSLVDGEDSFRRYLRLLIAHEARDALVRAETTAGPVRANVSLTPIHGVEDARRAIKSVRLEPVGEGRYRVRFRDLTVELWREGRPVETLQYNTTVTVSLPVLTLHDRTDRFQSRLHAGVQHPGFARDLTTRLFAITWVRGYAQYGGAPIENVLANRHVEAMGNDALLAQQTAVFGAADPRGRRLSRRAATQVALRDGLRGGAQAIDSRLKDAQTDGMGDSGAQNPKPVSLPSVFDSEQSFDVDLRADEAFLSYVEGDTTPGLDAVIDRIYTAQVRPETRASVRDVERFDAGQVPRHATRIDERHTTKRRLTGGSWSNATRAGELRRFDGTVVVEETTKTYWAIRNFTTTTTETRKSTYDVTVRLECAYRQSGLAPRKPMERCPFGPTAKSRLTDAAMETVVADAGGVDALAVDAVSSGTDYGWQRVDIEPPSQVRPSAYEGVATVRQHARDVSVSMRTRSIASSANPPALLADELRRQRSTLVDPPSRYESVAERAVIAARATYLDHLVDRLESQSPAVDDAQQLLADTLQEYAIPSRPPEGGSESLSRVADEIDADPAYLSIAARDGAQPPMASRNVNIFTVPYGDAADIFAAKLDVDGTESVSLRTAAQTLEVVSNDGDTDASEESVRTLRRAIGDSLDTVADSYRAELAPIVGEATAKRAVADAYARYDSPSNRALAVVDGRMAETIAESIPAVTSGTQTDLATVRLRVASASVRSESSVRIDEDLVESVASSTEETPVVATESAKAVGTDAGKQAWKRATGKSVNSLPAGLPLLPVPGSWYATVNAWTVSVRGSYDRFTVSSRRAAPGRATNGTIEYVRTDAPIAVDVTGDGRPERLGRNRPISFTAETGVVVVVPPGGTGVGDTDGNADERSPGW